MINELRYIFDEPELKSPKNFNESGASLENEFQMLKDEALRLAKPIIHRLWKRFHNFGILYGP